MNAQRSGARSIAGTDIPNSNPPEEIPEWLVRVRGVVENEAPIMQTVMMRAIQAVLSMRRTLPPI